MVAAERREQCVAAVEGLRDRVLGRLSAKVHQDVAELPPLPPLRVYRPTPALPFFNPSSIEPALPFFDEAYLAEVDLRKVSPGDLPTAAEPTTPRPTPLRDAAPRPKGMRDAVKAHLRCSTSWARLPATDTVSISLARSALQRASSLPSLQKKVPDKPTAPVKELLPFEAVADGAPRPEAFAPYLGPRGRHAELQLQQRLRR